MLPPEAQEVFDQEVVLVVSREDTSKGSYYPHEAFIAAMQNATLDRLVATTPKDATPRQASRAMAAMRTEASHKAVLQDALARLQRDCTAVEVQPHQRVVACFPGA